MKKEALQELISTNAKIEDGKIVFDLDSIHTKVNVFGTSMREKGEELGAAKGATDTIKSLGIESVKDVAGLKSYIGEISTGKTETETKLAGLTTKFETYKTDIDKTISGLTLESTTAKRDSLKVVHKFDPKYTDVVDFKVDNYMKENEGASLEDGYTKVKELNPEWVVSEVTSKGGVTPKTEQITEDEEAEFARLAGLK